MLSFDATSGLAVVDVLPLPAAVIVAVNSSLSLWQGSFCYLDNAAWSLHNASLLLTSRGFGVVWVGLSSPQGDEIAFLATATPAAWTGLASASGINVSCIGAPGIVHVRHHLVYVQRLCILLHCLSGYIAS